MITTDVKQVAAALLAGEVVAIPTETVYGLAACASNPAAVAKVFALKQRPLDHPLILHVQAGCDLHQWVQEVTPDAAALMARFWPGPLTLVFHTTEAQVPKTITGGQSSVAIRCPSHPMAQAVLAAVGEPLVAPSANPFGQVSPTTAAHVAAAFGEDLLVLDGGRCAVGIESTIVSVLAPQGYQLLRAGVIHDGVLQTVAPHSVSLAEKPRVSGQLARHYQPKKPIYWFETQAALQQAVQHFGQPVWIVAFSSPDPRSMAHEWYFQLHDADASNMHAIFVQLPPDTVECAGLRDRILRASKKYF